MAKQPAKKKQAARPEATPLLEMVVSGLGLILVLGALAVIAYEALQPRTPPSLTFRLAGVTQTPGGWVAEVEVENAGRETAAEVQIEGELTAPDGRTHTAQAALPYAPGMATETVGLIFPADPRRGALTLEARGWSEP